MRRPSCYFRPSRQTSLPVERLAHEKRPGIFCDKYAEGLLGLLVITGGIVCPGLPPDCAVGKTAVGEGRCQPIVEFEGVPRVVRLAVDIPDEVEGVVRPLAAGVRRDDLEERVHCPVAIADSVVGAAEPVQRFGAALFSGMLFHHALKGFVSLPIAAPDTAGKRPSGGERPASGAGAVRPQETDKGRGRLIVLARLERFFARSYRSSGVGSGISAPGLSSPAPFPRPGPTKSPDT